MANILLIEPNYKCKYPPLGLMKLAYYHKEIRNDTVWFCKGELPKKITDEVKEQLYKSKYYVDKYGLYIDKHIEKINRIITNNEWDRIYVSTLFTFEYEKTKQTIEYAKELVGTKKVYAGGILATLNTEKLKNETGITVNTGQLIDSKMIGYDDKLNIDILTPDYSILDNTEYEYENNDAYYAYTTRGCGMNCGFCAVKVLEPEFEPFISIKKQIKEVREKYGEKKDLLLMDNNVLRSKHLDKIIDEIIELGFYKGAVYKNPKTGKIKRRFVDFNQGLDSFLMTEDKAKLLSKIAIKPVRIAFDHIEDTDVYTDTIKVSAKNGINYLSNYLLYNADAFGGKGRNYKADTPIDLYRRLKINVDLQEELNREIGSNEDKVSIFSFPMRYIPLDNKQRGYVGTNWTKKYLRAIQTMLIPTQGKGVSGRSFFYAAFGNNEKEFMETILMPEAYIASRGKPTKIKNISYEELLVKTSKFEKYEKLRKEWRNLFNLLSKNRKEEFYNIVGNNKYDFNNFNKLKCDISKKLFIHYLSAPGLLTLIEKLYIEEQNDDILLIKDYLRNNGYLVYDELIKYVVNSNKSNKKIDMYKMIFGNQSFIDPINCWISNKCKADNFIDLITRLYEVNEVYLYIIKYIVQLGEIDESELNILLNFVSKNTMTKELDFLKKILDRVYEKIRYELDNKEVDLLVGDIKKIINSQLVSL